MNLSIRSTEQKQCERILEFVFKFKHLSIYLNSLNWLYDTIEKETNTSKLEVLTYKF